MRIAIIGAGNMGGAIARALVKCPSLKEAQIICTTRTQSSLDRLRERTPNMQFTLDNCAAVASADIVLLAVKPWLMQDVVEQIRPALNLEQQIIISVAAGISLDDMAQMLHSDKATIFRLIPNTAIEVMCSMTFFCSRNATEWQEQLIMQIFNEAGCAMAVEESKIEAGTALASCGIAFAMRYIRAAAEAGVELGFRAAEAHTIVEYTVKGAAELLLHNGNHPEAEIDKVTTAGGITIKGLNELEHAGFSSAVVRGHKACIK